MAMLRFRYISLEDWLSAATKDPNTRYIVYNEDESIYGEFIGEKKVTAEVEASIQALDDSKEGKSNKAQDFEIINSVLYPSVKATKDELDKKVDKILTIIGLDLQNNISLEDFKAALGNVTQLVAGLMLPEDKTHLDNLVALFNEDEDDIVNTIAEILAVFQNFPEGATILEVLATKVDKVEGKQLSTNDLTNTLKTYYDLAYAHTQIVNENPHKTTYQQLLDKPTTIEQAGITNVYNKQYIDQLKDQNGWKSQLLTLTPLAPSGTIATATLLQYDTLKLQVKNTATSFVDTDSVEVSLGVITGNKIQLSDTTVYLEIGTTNSTFVAPVGWELQIVGLKYTELKASDVATNEVGVTVQDKIDDYDMLIPALQNGVQKNGEINREQDYRIATIEEAYRKSQNGELTATKSGKDIISLGKDVANAPLQVKVDGGLLEAKQLVVNGNFSNGTTGWSIQTGYINDNSQLKLVTDGSVATKQSFQKISIPTGNKVYVSYKYRLTNYIQGQLNTQIADYNDTIQLSNDIITTAIEYTYGSKLVTSTNNRIQINLRGQLSPNYTSYWDDIFVFNISTLIANKTYSPLYNKTFDLMMDAEIKAQMDLWVQNGTLPNDNVLAVGMNKRVRSVGKNLFDKSKATLDGNRINETDGLPFPGNISTSGDGYTDYISIKPNTTYIWSGQTSSIYTYAFYDDNYDYINYVSYTQSFTTPSNAKYVRISVFSDRLNYLQLEQGSTATTYVPYANTDLYLQANKVGYKLPNGVADTIEYRNGKYYFVQRVQKYTLQASDITYLSDFPISRGVPISLPNDALGGSIGSAYSGQIFVFDWIQRDYNTAITSPLDMNYYYNENKQIAFIYTYASMPDLATAKTLLAGTVIYYQLATPIETEILALGNAQGLAGGTVYIDDIMADSNLYTSKYDIENTSYPIKSLERIVKINADGSQTELAVSSATVAGDGLSFTHPSLVANDIVWISYEYNVANLFKSNTFVTYYDNPFIAVQPNGTPRRIVFTVDDSGVVTVSSIAV